MLRLFTGVGRHLKVEYAQPVLLFGGEECLLLMKSLI